MRKIIGLFLLVIISLYGISQTTNEVYNTPYRTTGQSLWKEGTTGVFQIDQVFFDQNWNSSTNIGNIYNIAGMNFGAKLNASTWGSMGAGFQINFGTEKLNIDYNADMTINKPSNQSFDPGDEIILKTSFAPRVVNDTSINTDEYDANLRLWLKFGMGIYMHTKLCVFGCTEFDIINLNMPVDTFDIIKAGNLTGVSILNGLIEWPVGEAFPFSYTDPEDIITVDITLPSNAGANNYLLNKNLHSVVNPTSPYFNTYFSIPKFIGALRIPYVSAFFGNLSNSYNAGPFYLNYTLMEAGFNLGLFHKQHLTLTPTMKGKLDLPTKLDYTVYNASTGTVYSQGSDSVINYTVGNNIKLKYPCDYDFINITPSFNMENTFNNHTYDSIALDFVFEMLTFNMGMTAVTVIPRICFPIYYPCPSWSHPFRWCSYTLCTPALVFGGFNTGFGPLIEWQPNLFNVKYDWCDNTWSMQGFNSFNSMNSFILEPRKFKVDLSVNNILCHGNLTGSATATVTNGNPPYIYEWSNGNVVSSNSTTNTQTGLGAGTHYVIVRDTKDCSIFASSVIIEPELPLSINHLQTEPSCDDSFNGNISININGGTAGYSYLWSNSSALSSLTNLDAGDYTVTVTDMNSCTISETYTLTKPEALNTQVQKHDISCKGDNSGYAIFTTTGGTPEYSYNWSNGGTANYGTALAAGTYTVTITDYNSCQKIETIVINEPANVLSFTNAITNIGCYGASTGLISTTVTGGTAPYSYQWHNATFNILNQASNQITNMPAGNYSIIVTDHNNCSDTSNLVITQPDSLHKVSSVVDVLCKGFSTGEIAINLSGATPPFSYNWSNGSIVEDLSGVVSGNYTLTITDANHCQYILNSFVNEPEEILSVNSNATDVLCKGDTSGAVLAIPSGGTSPYTYLWSNSSNNQGINQISAGTYTVTVTDANGCLYYSGAVVSEPDLPLTINAVPNPVSCFGYQDGSLAVNLSGGTIPYTLIWDNNTYVLSTNQQSIEGLRPGVFNLFVTDANNCINNKSYTIGSPDSVIIDISATIVSCFNGNDGSIAVNIDGGTEPYTYLWSNSATTHNLELVAADLYQVSITDANNCEYHASIRVNEMSKNLVAGLIKPTSCKDLNDGSISLSVTGGAGSHHFMWSNGTTLQNAINLSSGSYQVLVSDDNHCETSLDFQIEPNNIECLEIPSSFSPNNDGINDNWVIRSLDVYRDASVRIFNKWGNLLYERQGVYIPWEGTFNSKPLPADVYYYIIDLNNGDRPYTGTITILR